MSLVSLGCGDDICRRVAAAPSASLHSAANGGRDADFAFAVKGMASGTGEVQWRPWKCISEQSIKPENVRDCILTVTIRHSQRTRYTTHLNDSVHDTLNCVATGARFGKHNACTTSNQRRSSTDFAMKLETHEDINKITVRLSCRHLPRVMQASGIPPQITMRQIQLHYQCPSAYLVCFSTLINFCS